MSAVVSPGVKQNRPQNVRFVWGLSAGGAAVRSGKVFWSVPCVDVTPCI